jgi:hypothetical protein
LPDDYSARFVGRSCRLGSPERDAEPLAPPSPFQWISTLGERPATATVLGRGASLASERNPNVQESNTPPGEARLAIRAENKPAPLMPSLRARKLFGPGPSARSLSGHRQRSGDKRPPHRTAVPATPSGVAHGQTSPPDRPARAGFRPRESRALTLAHAEPPSCWQNGEAAPLLPSR